MKNKQRSVPGLGEDPKVTAVCGSKALESINNGTKEVYLSSGTRKQGRQHLVGSRGLSTLHRPKQVFIQITGKT